MTVTTNEWVIAKTKAGKIKGMNEEKPKSRQESKDERMKGRYKHPDKTKEEVRRWRRGIEESK